MTRKRSRGLRAVTAIKAVIPDGVELDEVDEDLLAAIRRAYDRAEALDADLARERAAAEPSANRITLLAAEIRLQEQQGEKWGRGIIERVEALVKPKEKDRRAQHAANVRWHGVHTGGA